MHFHTLYVSIERGVTVHNDTEGHDVDIYIPPVHLPQMIVFVRHPQCLHNVSLQKAIVEGISHKESPLTKVGEQQCDITANFLKKKFTFDAVYCSEHLRTRAIPRAMFEVDFIPREYKELNECDDGIWHTTVHREVRALYPQEIPRYESDNPYGHKALHGESCKTVDDRLVHFLSLRNEHVQNKCVLISGHGISGLCLRRLLLGKSVDEWNAWYKRGSRFKNASVTVFVREGVFYQYNLYNNYAPWEAKRYQLLFQDANGS